LAVIASQVQPPTRVADMARNCGWRRRIKSSLKISMQSVVYKCDKCKKAIGNKPHISLSFNNFSGIAIPPELGRSEYWLVHEKIQGKFLHFCSVDHLATYFDDMMKRAISKFTKVSAITNKK
jgi:hypothetical protein